MRQNQRHHPPPAQYPTTTRIEAFSDGVIAIIITIMVLELRVPQLADEFTRQAFLEAAARFAPKLLAYAMSFVIVAIFWVNHHGFFHSLQKSDGKLLWYNNFMLFWMSLIPFGTAFLGEHPHSSEATAVFGFIMAMAGLSFPLMNHYAMFRSDLMRKDISKSMRHRGYRRSIIGGIAYSLSIIFAFVSPWAAWLIFFAVPIYYFMPRQFEEEGDDG